VLKLLLRATPGKMCFASYVHLHFGSAPELAHSLVASCQGVDLNAVNAAAARACHQEQHAAAAAEQQAIIHGGHMNGHMGMQNGGLHGQAHLPKMMSVPDFAMPFQSSFQRSSHLGRRSADDAEIPCAHTQLQQHQQQQFLQQAHQQQLPRKVRYDPDGRIVALDVYAQAYNPADYQSLSPQRTSSLPIFHKPLKPHSLPTSPLHDVAEHSSMEAPAHAQGYPTSHWGSQPGMVQQPQHQQSVYPQPHQQLHQQPLQQLGQQQQRSPFHSPLQITSLHGSQSPTYPPPLETANSGALPMNAILHPNGTLVPADVAMLPTHSGMLSSTSGMLSVNSGMLPDGVVYRPNSMSDVHPDCYQRTAACYPVEQCNAMTE